MPHLSCPACRLTTYSAAAHATSDRCPRCDAPLGDPARVSSGVRRRWDLSDLRLSARQKGVARGTG
ncbi:MAG TPA: hypothetical protein VFE09_06745 [Rubrobacteraceae bacterium]|nr:hypothetical protein [Rubrobacteraceae bacterium]